MGEPESYVVGVDFGTLSARAVVVRVSDGAELGDAVHDYRHGVVEDRLPASGQPLPPAWALQVADDYRGALREVVPAAVRAAHIDPSAVIAIGTDFTACTMVPCLADGTPLNEVPGLEEQPHAYVKLWKHHAAQPQADRITALAVERGEPWLSRYGGAVSSEGELAKGLQLFEEDPELYTTMDKWVEATDWIVWQLCGDYVRSASAAGYKAAYQDGTYPSEDFLAGLHPGFATFVADKVRQPVAPLGARAGTLSAEAASWTGLSQGIPVAVGSIDAHATAPAAGAADAGQLVAILGTSACYVVSAPQVREVPGMSGVVDGGILPGLWGYEAGQSGVGDIFGWFVRTCVPASYAGAAHEAGEDLHEHLTRLAASQAVGEHGLVALDWHSGNRSVLADHDLSGLVLGLTLATRPEELYRALLEATAFGARMIIDTFRRSGVPVDELTIAGGLTKNELLGQIYADVLDLPISVIASDQGAALGSAIHAAVAAGAHADLPTAARAMGKVRRDVYLPDAQRVAAYQELYGIYVDLHDRFGRQPATMRRLTAIRRSARAGLQH
jgi:L-ribulokinase